MVLKVTDSDKQNKQLWNLETTHSLEEKDRKSNFRRLWITRINAGARINGLTYSNLINGLKKANVIVNRKMLAELAITDEKAFADICTIAKNAK